ncbi:PAAR domain-containing protein [Pseudomonas sp. PDM18]|uniref:PAAR domain-containing protein n=1 Tax=Pseudomonas sp. PDM18 TaxID=2769253 RepID=UPI00177AFE8D|nr:PAAR domain-containing protein [Pseudomonas sp. PDM18]MBD9680432.1 PAAR domain-containing protein [Pseudomonas sp. PDM18]
MRALACLGDQTTYGNIISATATWFEGDKAIAQLGDKAWCGKCNGAFPIIGTAYEWSEKQPYVATGDKVACRCPDHVVYGSTTQFTTSPAAASTRSSGEISATDTLLNTALERPTYKGRVQLLDLEGAPISGLEYKFVDASGGPISRGAVDGTGRSPYHEQDASAVIAAYVGGDRDGWEVLEFFEPFSDDTQQSEQS